MFSRMQALLDRMTTALLTGETEAMAARCQFPLVIHAPGDLVPFFSAADYAATMRHLGLALRRDHRVTGITAHLRCLEIRPDGRFRAFARLTYAFADDTPPHQTNVTYYCREAASGIRVEMVETDCALLTGRPARGVA